jgi:D-lactate dehydrogenase (cytochrome)
MLIDPDRPDEMRKAEAVNKRLVRRAIAMGGTCTGEHGVGYGKIDSVAEEHGEAVAVMATLKRALDPQDIMNPGKIVRLGAR